MGIVRPDQSSSGGGGGGSVTVTDGTHAVANVTTLDFTAGVTVSDAGGGQANASVTAGAPTFTPTATKTANYTAAAGEYVVGDSTAGAFTVTLPAAPANGTLVAVQQIGSANAITVAAGVGDTINATTNSSLGTTRRSALYEYRSSDKVWFAIAPATNPVLSVGVDGTTLVNTGTSTAPNLHTGTLDAIATAQPPTAAVAFNSQPITGAQLVAIAGGTGAAAATRIVGANASGAPASGTWNTGDVAVGQNGHLFVCTAGGTPGTWVDAGSASNPNLATVLGVGNAAGGAKITGLAAGSTAGDSVRYEQAIKSGDTAGGILTGTYPNPTSLAPGFEFRYTTATYYSGNFGGAGTTQAATSGVAAWTPFYVARSTSFDQIGVFIGTSAASAVLRLGIYADTGNGAPGALVVDAGTIDASTTGAKTLTISQTLQGLYWLCCPLQVATGAGPYLIQVNQQMTRSDNNTGGGWTQASVSGALPGTATPVYAQTRQPWMYLRAA